MSNDYIIFVSNFSFLKYREDGRILIKNSKRNQKSILDRMSKKGRKKERKKEKKEGRREERKYRLTNTSLA